VVAAIPPNSGVVSMADEKVLKVTLVDRYDLVVVGWVP
jgi:hypothetical protein